MKNSIIMKSILIIIGIIIIIGVVIAVVVGVTPIDDISINHKEKIKNEEMEAIITFNIGTYGINGDLYLKQKNINEPVQIMGIINGLEKKTKLYGLHIHENGDIHNGCISTGNHFNPDKHNHGGKEDLIRHIGDLGNIKSDENGIVHINMTDNIIQLSGKNSIIGRAFVIHADEDDLGKGGNVDSLKTGNAGIRLSCGIIGIIYKN